MLSSGILHRMVRFLLIVIIAFVGVLALMPSAKPRPTLAQTASSCGVSNFDVTDPNHWIFIGYSTMSPCYCPPTEQTVGLYSPVGVFKQYSCTQPPPPPPNKPGIDAGAACLGGTSRTVTLQTAGGSTFQVEMNPGSVILSGSGTTYTFTNLQQGIGYTFQAQASDSNGSSGWSAWTPAVQQDTTPPTTTYTPVGIAGTNGWWKSQVSVTLPAVDSGCLGVKQTTYTLDNVAGVYTGTPFVVSGEGSHVLTYVSTDGSNVEVTKTQTIKIDTVAPSLSLIPDRAPDGAAGWWRSAVTVTIPISDATSGVASQTISVDGQAFKAYDSKPVALTTDGKHILDVQVTDAAGNTSVKGMTIPIDSTPPVSTVQYSGTLGSNGWYTSPSVTVTLTATDVTSGVLQSLLSVDGGTPTTSNHAIVTGEGTHWLDYGSVDRAGNVEQIHHVPVMIDSVPPTLILMPDRAPDNATTGWWRSAVTVKAAIGDATSGVALQQISLDGQPFTAYDGNPILIKGDLVHQLSLRVTAVSGLTTTKSLTIPLDSTAPTSSLYFGDQGGGNAWHVISPVQVSVSATDGLSGVAHTYLSVDGQPAVPTGQLTVSGNGVHTVNYYAVDVAGNVEAMHTIPVSIDTGSPSVDSVTCSASQIQPTGDFALSADLFGSSSGIWQVKLTAYPDGGTPFQVDSTTLNLHPTQTQVTLHFHPSSAQVGHYWFGLFVMDFSGQSVSPGSLCSLNVSTSAVNLSSGVEPTRVVVHFPTRTPTPIPSSTPTLADSPTSLSTSSAATRLDSPTSTIPPTNTLASAGVLNDGLLSSLTPTPTMTDTPEGTGLNASAPVGLSSGLLPTDTLSPTPGVPEVALLSPNNNPNTAAVITQPPSSPSSSGAPDLAGLLAQAALAMGAGATLLATAWAQKKRQDLSQQQAQDEALLSSDLTQQAKQAQANAAQNAAMQTAAGQDVSIASAPSDFEVWYLQQLAKVPEWEHEVKLWNYDQAVKQYEEAKQQYAAAMQKAKAAAAYAAQVNAERKTLLSLAPIFQPLINTVKSVIGSVSTIFAAAQDAARKAELADQEAAMYQRLLHANADDFVEAQHDKAVQDRQNQVAHAQLLRANAQDTLEAQQEEQARQNQVAHDRLLRANAQDTLEAQQEEQARQNQVAHDRLLRANAQDILEAQQEEQARQAELNRQRLLRANEPDVFESQPVAASIVPAHTAADYAEVSDAQKRQVALVALSKRVEQSIVSDTPLTPEDQDLWNSASPSEQAQAQAAAYYVPLNTATATPLTNTPTTSTSNTSSPPDWLTYAKYPAIAFGSVIPSGKYVPIGTVENVPIQNLLYSQAWVSKTMNDGQGRQIPVTQTVQNMIDKLQTGDTSWEGDPPVGVKMSDGTIALLDNRRVVASNLAGRKDVPTDVVDGNKPIDTNMSGRFALKDGADSPELDQKIGELRGDTNLKLEPGDTPKTFEEAAIFRFANQRVIGDPNFPLSGSPNTVLRDADGTNLSIDNTNPGNPTVSSAPSTQYPSTQATSSGSATLSNTVGGKIETDGGEVVSNGTDAISSLLDELGGEIEIP